jgi:hypothetical protein
MGLEGRGGDTLTDSQRTLVSAPSSPRFAHGGWGLPTLSLLSVWDLFLLRIDTERVAEAYA